MILLHPIPDVSHACPYCQIGLEVRGWYIPGMRNLADLRCERCGRAFYGDLCSGQALYTPLLMEKESGIVHDAYGMQDWLAPWLRKAYENRTSGRLELTIKKDGSAPPKAVFLNCLDRVYGHCLLKLINAEYYLNERRDLGLIIMIPRCLEWMVPDRVAETWIVDLPLSRGTEWNDWLAGELDRRISRLETCWLSVAFSHPHPDDYNIERFTRVRPFPVEEWENRLPRPKITYVWREDNKDRIWYAREKSNNGRKTGLMHSVKDRLFRRIQPAEQQRQQVLKLASSLRANFPGLDFTVAGLGKPGGMSNWITDLRRPYSDEATERIWCENYASSHVVVGVHGSNMLLPSAHAGATVELVPPEKWVNIPEATLFRRSDPRVAVYRYRYYPLNTTPDDLAIAISKLLTAHRFMTLSMPKAVADHFAISHSSHLIEFLRSV